MLNKRNHEIKASLEQAKELQTLYFSTDPQCISSAIQRLHETDLNLDLQEADWSSLCKRVNNSLEALTSLITQDDGKRKPGLSFYNLINKKLAMFIEDLKNFRTKAENQRITLQCAENEPTDRVFELLRQDDGRTEKKLQNSVLFEERLKKHQALNHLELEKIQVEIQLKRFRQKILSENAIKVSLKERKKEIEGKLNQRKHQVPQASAFDKLLMDVDEKMKQECACNISIQEELYDLQENLPTRAISSPQEIDKKFHFIFLVDISETMDGKTEDIENCINSLLQDRKSRDLYSLIFFNDLVEIEVRERNIDPSIKISLPELNWSNKAYSEALKQAYNIIDKSSSCTCSPVLILFTDCLKPGSLRFGFGSSINSKMLSRLCEEGKKLHSAFKKLGLLFFISYSDLSSQQGLRKLASDANGGKSFIEGVQDNHDFLNQAKYSQALPQIFRDLNFSSLKIKPSQTINSEIDVSKSRITHLQATLNEKKKLIDDLGKEKEKLSRLQRTILDKNFDEWQKVTTLYEEKLRELNQKEEDSDIRLAEYFRDLDLEKDKNLRIQESISCLKKEIGESSSQDQLCLSQIHDPLIINLRNINIGKSIDAFNKTKSMLLERRSNLLKNISLLVVKAEELSVRLEARVNFEYVQSQGLEKKEETSIGAIIGTGIRYWFASPILSEVNDPQLKRERCDKIPTFLSETELLYQCSEIQKLILNF